MSRLLFVDDEPNVLEGLMRMARATRLPCEVEAVGSAAAALARIQLGGIDLVVTDVHMPAMDGFELLSRIRQEPGTEHLPVIMLTGSLDSDARRRSLELGATDFVTKPAVPAEFSARVRNILKLKLYRDRLAEQNELLETQILSLQKLENVGTLAAGLVHDLNNVLTAVGGHVQLALNKCGDPAAVSRHAKSALDSAAQAGQLVEQLLRVSKPHVGDWEMCDIVSVVDSGLHLLEASKSENVAIYWIPPREELSLSADSVQIGQVIMNLCINAMQAMSDHGEIRISVQPVRLSEEMHCTCGATLLPNDYICLQVNDTGGGIPPEAFPHLFDPFFTTKPAGQGTGLGLFVVGRVAHNHNGGVMVESAPGRGTTFSVYFKSGAIDRVSVGEEAGVSGRAE
ncbi:MAG TPA: response regulator [candidate division Zixibacteria bacterium]|jgi:signal transduction histidine kinase